VERCFPCRKANQLLAAAFDAAALSPGHPLPCLCKDLVR
jgi:hypothetical protein